MNRNNIVPRRAARHAQKMFDNAARALEAAQGASGDEALDLEFLVGASGHVAGAAAETSCMERLWIWIQNYGHSMPNV